jgi:hypothetical protein
MLKKKAKKGKKEVRPLKVVRARIVPLEVVPVAKKL